MPEPTFNKVEESGGEILHDEPQNKLIDEMVEALPDASVRGGVCKAMCAKWITSSATNQDFWEHLHSGPNRETMRLLQHQEAASNKILSSALKTAKHDGSFDRNETNLKLMEARVKQQLQMGDASFAEADKQAAKLKDGWASDYIHKNTGLAAAPLSDVKPDELVRKLSEGTGYYLFGIEFKDGGGHAMALYNMPGVGIQYFDPNFGEAIFTDPAKFQTWMQQHLNNYGSSQGVITQSKMTFVERKVAPDRTDLQSWVVDNAGPTRPSVPSPTHWPAYDSAKAMQEEKQRARDLAQAAKHAEDMQKIQAQFGNQANGRQNRRGAIPPNVPVQQMAAIAGGNPVNIPQLPALANDGAPPNAGGPNVGGAQPLVAQQPIVRNNAHRGGKASWRKAGVLSATDLAQFDQQ